MKSFFTGLHKVFAFTLRQRVINRGWKTATALIAALCLLLPPAIMALCELAGSDSETELAAVSDIYLADLSGGDTFDFSMLNFCASAMSQDAYSHISYHPYKTSEEALEAAENNRGISLALILEKRDGRYCADVILPDSSVLSMDDADGYRDFLDQAFSLVILYKSGISLTDLMALNNVSYEYSYYSSDGDTETLISGDNADSRQNLDASVKDVLSFVLPFVNIMLLYFLILFYGQGTANCVVMEKASKLMDTLLLSVKPEAVILRQMDRCRILLRLPILTHKDSCHVKFCTGQ